MSSTGGFSVMETTLRPYAACKTLEILWHRPQDRDEASDVAILLHYRHFEDKLGHATLAIVKINPDTNGGGSWHKNDKNYVDKEHLTVRFVIGEDKDDSTFVAMRHIFQEDPLANDLVDFYGKRNMPRERFMAMEFRSKHIPQARANRILNISVQQYNKDPDRHGSKIYDEWRRKPDESEAVATQPSNLEPEEMIAVHELAGMRALRSSDASISMPSHDGQRSSRPPTSALTPRQKAFANSPRSNTGSPIRFGAFSEYKIPPFNSPTSPRTASPSNANTRRGLLSGDAALALLQMSQGNSNNTMSESSASTPSNSSTKRVGGKCSTNPPNGDPNAVASGEQLQDCQYLPSASGSTTKESSESEDSSLSASYVAEACSPNTTESAPITPRSSDVSGNELSDAVPSSVLHQEICCTPPWNEDWPWQLESWEDPEDDDGDISALEL